MSTTDIGSYVVTGGAHGVGRAIAERLARDGHVVVLDSEARNVIRSGRPGDQNV
jgi:NAD(P)-dependent dehydrogenase (short-subunit alcohol dehydrogenase family)